MKQVEKIWSEMALKKEEFASKKVELMLADKLQAFTKEAKDLIQDLEASQKDIKKALDVIANAGMTTGDELDAAEQLDNQVEQLIMAAEAKAKFLGLTINDMPPAREAIKVRQALRDVFNETYRLYQKLDF